MSQPSILQVKQSHEEEFEFNVDIEHVFNDPSRPSKNPTAVNVEVETNGGHVDEEDADAISDDMDGDNEGATETSKKSKFASLCFLNNKIVCGIAAAAMLGFTAIIGASIGGYSAAFNRQQMNALAVNAAGKAGKGQVSFCEPEHDVTSCGQTFVNEKVVLLDDLICMESVNDDDVTNPQLRTLNAAIKLEGPDASIDCKGFTVRQSSENFGSNAANCPNRMRGVSLGPHFERKDMKLDCDLYYQVGIWLKDGATAVNCKSEHFYDGFFLHDGGEIKKSEASRNRQGINVLDEVVGSTSKVSNV